MDYVFECTGKFNSKDKLEPHLKNGAKKVLVSAPCKGADNIVFGVNHKNLNIVVSTCTSCELFLDSINTIIEQWLSEITINKEEECKALLHQSKYQSIS